MQTRLLIDAAKTFAKGVLTVRKTAGEARVIIRAGEREVSLPAQSYTPADLPGGRAPVMSVGGDAMAGPKRPTLALLHFEVKDGRLALIAADGHRLAAASVAAPPAAAALNHLNIAAPTAERLAALVDEAVRLARPRGRGAASRAAPMMQLLVPSQTEARAMIVRTELFTFAAAHTSDTYPPYERVVPAADTFDGVCVVSARELQDALRPSAKGEVSLEFATPLVVRNIPDDGTPAISITIRDVFVDGPSRRIRLRTAYVLSAVESIAGTDEYLCLATASATSGVVVAQRCRPRRHAPRAAERLDQHVTNSASGRTSVTPTSVCLRGTRATTGRTRRASTPPRRRRSRRSWRAASSCRRGGATCRTRHRRARGSQQAGN